MKILGIDLGTTTISAVVIDTKDKSICSSVTRANAEFLTTENPWEKLQDADVVLQKAEEVIQELVLEHPDLAAVGVTGQMHGIVYVDQNGNAVSPLYSWQDGSGDLPVLDGKSACEEIWEKYQEKTSSGYGLATCYFQTRTRKVPKNAVGLCTIGDYLVMKLTGQSKPLIHSSNGASLGFYDAKEGKWKWEKLEKSGIDLSLLPQVTQDFCFYGKYRNLPVAVAIGDNQASFLGAADQWQGTVLVNVGTGSQVSVYSEKYWAGDGIEARPLEKGSYLLVGSCLCGGRAYGILEKFFRDWNQEAGICGLDCYQIMERFLETSTKDCGGLKVRTTFSGTRELPKKKGSIWNITTENFTPQNLICAVLNGMTEELYEWYKKIEDHTGIKGRKIIASGNGLRKNPYLLKTVENKFAMDVSLAKGQEEAAQGAAEAARRAFSK